MELQTFASKNFEKPSDCKDLDQIRFYVQELCHKIEALKKEFNYVPPCAYQMLSQYNAVQNKILHADFRSTYK